MFTLFLVIPHNPLQPPPCHTKRPRITFNPNEVPSEFKGSDAKGATSEERIADRAEGRGEGFDEVSCRGERLLSFVEVFFRLPCLCVGIFKPRMRGETGSGEDQKGPGQIKHMMRVDT